MTPLGFPYCCAYTILAGFGDTTTGVGGGNSYTPEQITKFLNDQESEAKLNRKALMLIAINADQREKMRPILKSLNWVCVDKSFHPNHNTFVYLWKKSLEFTQNP